MPKKVIRRYKRSVDKKQNKEINKLKKKVSKLASNTEKKWYDTNQLSKAISTTTAVDPFLGLTVWNSAASNANETRSNSRAGNSIVMTALKLDGLVYIDQAFASPDSNNIVRLLLVQMTDDNQSAPAATDILESNDVNSFYKLKGTRRYKVHYDKRFYLQNVPQEPEGQTYNSPTSTEPWRKRFIIKAKIPKKGLKITYSQGSISGNGPVTNGFFLLSVSDSAVISHPAMIYRSRLRFLDN